MTDFHDVSFPWHLAFGASGGPERQTEITQLGSGAERRNSRHYNSRRRYQASLGIKTYQQAIEILSFFEARRGWLYSFRFRDRLDFTTAMPDKEITATDQIIGTGDGQQTEFALIKTYADSAGDYHRRITKPVTDTLLLALDGVAVDTSNYSVDPLTGKIIFNSPSPSGAVVTAGFEFDVPVRFDTDRLDITLDDFQSVQITDVPLIEVLDHV